MPAFSDLKNMHYVERVVLRDTAYMETIEAAMRAVAVEVYSESPTTPGHEKRKQIAINIALSGTDITSEAARYRNLFATVVVQNAKLRGQFFDVTDPANAAKTIESRIRPWLMIEADLRDVIRGAWNAAANVQD